MRAETGGRGGVARNFALILGVAYVALALTEAIAKQALEPVLPFTGALNAIHWTLGTILLLSFFGGETQARSVVRAVAVVFLSVTIFGVVARTAAGHALGFPETLPWSCDVLNAVTCAASVYAGFVVRSPGVAGS